MYISTLNPSALQALPPSTEDVKKETDRFSSHIDSLASHELG